MKPEITYDNLRLFAYVNDAIVTHPIRGIMINFFGLGDQSRYSTDPEYAKYFASRGILYVFPYNDPWNWMNASAVSLTDAILDVLFERYHLPGNLPIVSSGWSMGGQCALTYPLYAARKPVACVANCPVCDTLFHYMERDDLPRTFLGALSSYDGSLREGLKSISPLHLLDCMPRINYHIFHCEEDKAVNIDAHSRRLVSEMRSRGFSVTFDTVPQRGHCDLTKEAFLKFDEYIVNEILSHSPVLS